MTDVKAPVSAPVFGQHIHFAIGPAPVAAPTVSHHNSTATEKDAKAGDGQPFNAASTSQNGTLSGSVAVPAVSAVSAGDSGDAKAEEEPAGAGSVPPAVANVSIGEKRKAEKDKGECEADGAGDSRSNGKEDMSEAAVSGALPLTVAPEATKETKTTANDGPAAKKAKVDAKTSLEDAASEETVNAVVETQAKKSNNNSSNSSSTRAKKEKKKPLPPVGRTARKTRSQGPADA